MSLRDAAASKARKLMSAVADSDVVNTLRHSGLFGAGGHNPWVSKLEDLGARATRAQAGRTFNLSGLDDATASKFIQEAQEALKSADMFGGGQALRDVAEKYNLQEHGQLRKIYEHIKGAAGYANPVRLLTGSQTSRTQLMHDLWEGGLIGKGSPIYKTLMPGEAVGKNLKKYKNVLMGREAMPSLREVGSDALATAGGVAKPLLVGGAIFPAASIANRVSSPESYDESALRGSLRDAGWYAGTTMGVPLGLIGIRAGSAAGQQIGDAVGAGLESALGKVTSKASSILDNAPNFSASTGHNN